MPTRHSMPPGSAPMLAACIPALVAFTYADQAAPVAPSPSPDFQVDTVATGLEHPWGLALLPDGRFLVTERNQGHLRLGAADGPLSAPLEGVPEVFRFQGETGRSQAGLFDVVLHPSFVENGWVYLSLSKPTPRGAALAVVRGTLNDSGTPRLDDVEEIFVMAEEDQDSSGLHFGGRLAFGVDGFLYLSVGERRNISRAQDTADQAGSILRMTDAGDPAGAVAGPGDPEANPHIWSYGHRNPQALAIQPGTGAVWIADHGPLGGDAVFRVEEGRNHGWPLYTEGTDYSGAPLGYEERPGDVVAPVHTFDETVAPSGAVFYEGNAFPQWNGHLLMGGLVAEDVIRLALAPDGSLTQAEPLALGLDRRIRAIEVSGQDGSIWILTEHEDGELLRLSATVPTPDLR